MKVSQFEDKKNQFLIEHENGQTLQSYDSAVAMIDRNGIIHLSEHWDYSRTTMKYVNHFVGMDAKNIRVNIEKGLIKTDLNHNTGRLVGC